MIGCPQCLALRLATKKTGRTLDESFHCKPSALCDLGDFATNK